MSVVPELIFQTTISRGIHTLRTDSRYIDQLFGNLSQGDQAQMRTFIQHNTVDLNIGYPTSPLSVPAIVILLRSDDESPDGAYLNDFMGIGTPDSFGYEGDLDGELLGGSGPTSGLAGAGSVVFGPHRVLSATLNTLSVSDRVFYAGQFSDGYDRLTVHLVGGTGAGQVRTVIANSMNNLMVDTNWTTVPDTTTVFEIRNPAPEMVGQPSKLYDTRDASTILERKGGLYTNKYQIQLITSNSAQLIYLYAIVKGIFTLSRVYMEGQGMINMRMGGTDLVNRPEYAPERTYMRQMSVTFESPFDVFVPLDNIIEQFTLCLVDGLDGEILAVSPDPVDVSPQDTTITGP